MESTREAQEWIAAQLAWADRLAELRAAYAASHGREHHPAATWDQPIAA